MVSIGCLRGNDRFPVFDEGSFGFVSCMPSRACIQRTAPILRARRDESFSALCGAHELRAATLLRLFDLIRAELGAL
jgi:hypothetical protein